MILNSFPKSNFETFLEQRRVEGWLYFGSEKLTKTQFSGEAKFEEVPYQTEDSIKKKHEEIAKSQDPSSEFEVELVLDENTEKLRRFRDSSTELEYQDILKNLRDRDKEYFVFVRRKS